MSWLDERRAQIDAFLDAQLARAEGDGDPGRLLEAMRYSALAPGKRLRPALALAAAEAVGGVRDDVVLRAACAVELVHAYSLVHDDLPAMDDDDVRRGRPTCHKAFDEATAILVGDALLTLAFEWIADAGMASGRAGDFLRAARALAWGAGAHGMVRGQARDLGEPPPVSLEALEVLHAEKTGALFRAALEVGACAGGAGADDAETLGRLGVLFGIAFQHADDFDDVEHVAHAAEARARVRVLCAEATALLGPFGERARPLHGVIDELARRAAFVAPAEGAR